MAGSKLAETRQEITDNTERVHVLVREGNRQGANELAAATERLIKSLRGKAERERLADDLTTALAAPEVETEKKKDITAIEGMAPLIEKAGKAMSAGVLSHRQGAEFARTMARHMLDLRLLIANPSDEKLPDLMSHSQQAREAASRVYSRAGEIFADQHPEAYGAEGTNEREETTEALESLSGSVQAQMSDITVQFLRSLDDDRETAEKHFGAALAAYPDDSPTEAVYKSFAAAGQDLPRVGRFERRRLMRALKRAQDSGDDKTVREIEARIGKAPGRQELPPAEVISRAVKEMRRSSDWADSAVKALPESDEETRREVRKAAEEMADRARAIVAATL